LAEVAIKLRILNTLALVPKGQVISYGKLADFAGLPKRARMVSKYLKQANTPINWHRVVRSDGKIAFPAGSLQADEQCQRLMAEGIVIRKNKVNMSIYAWEPDLYTLLAKLKY
jgi:methylated-DNA-protein-cysteine methyltransferase-like protein